MSDQLDKIGKLLAHAEQVGGDEQRTAYAMADSMLDEHFAAKRINRIESAAVETIDRAAVLKNFRAVLSMAEGSGRLSNVGRRLLNLLRSAPASPERKFTTPNSCAFFAWHRDNDTEIRELIAQL